MYTHKVPTGAVNRSHVFISLYMYVCLVHVYACTFLNQRGLQCNGVYPSLPPSFLPSFPPSHPSLPSLPPPSLTIAILHLSPPLFHFTTVQTPLFWGQSTVLHTLQFIRELMENLITRWYTVYVEITSTYMCTCTILRLTHTVLTFLPTG